MPEHHLVLDGRWCRRDALPLARNLCCNVIYERLPHPVEECLEQQLSLTGDLVPSSSLSSRRCSSSLDLPGGAATHQRCASRHPRPASALGSA